MGTRKHEDFCLIISTYKLEHISIEDQAFFFLSWVSLPPPVHANYVEIQCFPNTHGEEICREKQGGRSDNWDHRLNMELDLQSLFGLLCTAVLIGWDFASPPFTRILGSYTRALLVCQDRRHLFVTTWLRRRGRGEGRVVDPLKRRQNKTLGLF